MARNRYYKDSEARILWGLAAGRCEFEGCNCFLGDNPITGEKNNYAEKAHIKAVNRGGARFSKEMSNEELNSTDNIMLLCARCHKTIDDNEYLYPVERLLEMKKKHEERVFRLTEYEGVQKSFMLGYFADIDDCHPEYENNLFCKALINDKKIPSEKQIRMIGSHNSVFCDGTQEYYQEEQKRIEQGIERVYEMCVQKNENVSVFALAPIPLLMKLGEKLKDKSNISVYQCHRNESKWSWERENNDIVKYHIHSSRRKNQKKVALNISLSVTIDRLRIIKSVGDISVYTITIDNPNREFVKNKHIVDSYVVAYRKCLERIRNDNPEIEEILIFPAMPNSLAIRTGMDYMSKCDPKLVIYDKVKQSDAFIETLVIGG